MVGLKGNMGHSHSGTENSQDDKAVDEIAWFGHTSEEDYENRFQRRFRFEIQQTQNKNHLIYQLKPQHFLQSPKD